MHNDILSALTEERLLDIKTAGSERELVMV